MKNTKRRNPGATERDIQFAARRRAEEQARRIRWDRLLQTRGDYINWTEFYFWARSIMEADSGIPDWLKGILRERIPGFIEYDLEYRKAHSNETPLPWQRLTEWINEHVFESAHQEGWLEAITFYAARDPRSQRATAYWRECRTRWKRQRPSVYPSFEAWRRAAENCDYGSLLRPDIRATVLSSTRVPRERFAATVEGYVDWEAFAYWARSALEAGNELPTEVEDAIQLRCPGFLDLDRQARRDDPPAEPRSWDRLLAWGEKQFFGDAKKEGWLDAVLLDAACHPRRMQTAEYWAHWDSRRSQDSKSSYPFFQDWRKDADEYVDVTRTESRSSC